MVDFFKNMWSFIATTITHISIFDIVDILLVSVLVYTVIKFARDTRAAQLFKGIILLIILLQVAELLNLSATRYILNSCLEFGVLAVIILFQPELRNVLEKMGRKSFGKIIIGQDEEGKSEESTKEMISNLTKAVSNFSATKTGALIVIERITKLGNIISTGKVLDASTTPELVMNIFFNKAPLHDGAMIIRNNRIIAAGCILPLSDNLNDPELGTRHRAGLGMSENSDAIVIIVSEETGIISTAIDGKLTRRLTPDALANTLTKLLMAKKDEKKEFLPSLWKGRKKEK
mgnify:CR=1 FL=1